MHMTLIIMLFYSEYICDEIQKYKLYGTSNRRCHEKLTVQFSVSAMNRGSDETSRINFMKLTFVFKPNPNMYLTHSHL